MDDDDGSGDEAEKLDDAQMNELEGIYHKWVDNRLLLTCRAQMNDQRLGEMDPPETFLYTLRPYQKQALMCAGLAVYR